MPLNNFKNQITSEFKEIVNSININYDYLEIEVSKNNIYSFLTILKDEYGFNMLSDLTCVDFLGEKERFELVYNLFSLSNHIRILIKVRISETAPEIISSTSIFQSANWFEREIFDMFGILFTNHPNLKRLFLYEEFVGHPLRKDYKYNKRQPLTGPDKYICSTGIDGGESFEQLKSELIKKDN